MIWDIGVQISWHMAKALCILPLHKIKGLIGEQHFIVVCVTMVAYQTAQVLVLIPKLKDNRLT